MTEQKALPCPFCGGTEDRQETSQGFKWGAVVCSLCTAQGPEVRTSYGKPEEWRADAVAEWNRRAASVEAV